MTVSLDSDDPRAWLASGPEQITAGVWRVPLPLPIDGLSAVNAYVFVDGDEAVVVDPGWAGQTTDAALERAFDEIGTGWASVSTIVVTHTHPDHYGNALEMRRRHGVPILVGAAERVSVEAYRAGAPLFPRQIERLREVGAGELAERVDAAGFEPYETGLAWEAPDGWLDDGQGVRLAGSQLIARATPGHTRGHIVLYDERAGVLVTGDHVLPRITPSIGLEYVPERYPLRSFLRSLGRVRALPDAMMLPAHGNVTRSVHARVDTLLGHHERRLDEVAGWLARGESTAFGVATRLRWTRHGYALDELPTRQQMLAVLEIGAHLDVLELRNTVRSTVDDGVTRHRLAS